MVRVATTGLVTLAMAGVVFGLVAEIRRRASENELRETRIAAANHAAALDEGQRYIARLLGEQVAVFQRRAYQQEIRAELAQDSLEERATAIAQLTIEADSLRRIITRTASADTMGVIVTADTLDAADTLGVTAAASVELTPDPVVPLLYAARWTWELRRAAIPMRLELTCREHEAIARVSGPTWAPIVLDSVAQEPVHCNPPQPAWQPFTLKAPSVTQAAVIVAMWEGVRAIVGLLTHRGVPE